MCGVKTNIVTAGEIHDRDAADTKLLPALLRETARNFRVAEVSADKVYVSVKKLEAIEEAGAVPLIAFKTSHTGSRGGALAKAFHYFMYRREEFLEPITSGRTSSPPSPWSSASSATLSGARRRRRWSTRPYAGFYATHSWCSFMRRTSWVLIPRSGRTPRLPKNSPRARGFWAKPP